MLRNAHSTDSDVALDTRNFWSVFTTDAVSLGSCNTMNASSWRYIKPDGQQGPCHNNSDDVVTVSIILLSTRHVTIATHIIMKHLIHKQNQRINKTYFAPINCERYTFCCPAYLNLLRLKISTIMKSESDPFIPTSYCFFISSMIHPMMILNIPR